MEGVEDEDQKLSGILLVDLLEVPRDLVQGRFPGNGFETGVDADTLFRVGPSQGGRDSRLGGDSFHPRVPLGAGLPFVVRVFRVAHDLVDVAVLGAVGKDPAAVETEDAGRAHPVRGRLFLFHLIIQRADHGGFLPVGQLCP